MSKFKESYVGQWSAALTASGATYLGAHIADKEAGIGSNSITGTIEWLGVAGATVSGTMLALGSIGLYAARNQRKDRLEVAATIPHEQRVSVVPEFNADASAEESAAKLVGSLNLSDRVQRMLAPVADTSRASELERQGCTQEDRVKMVTGQMAANLALIRSEHPLDKELKARWFDVADVGYVLDQVYPIDHNDKLAPVTVPGERHWFDFAEQQAIALLTA